MSTDVAELKEFACVVAEEMLLVEFERPSSLAASVSSNAPVIRPLPLSSEPSARLLCSFDDGDALLAAIAGRRRSGRRGEPLMLRGLNDWASRMGY